MARITTIQTFHSVADLKLTHKVVLPKPHDDWRLIQEPYQGEINGCPTLRGTAIATNGIMVAILQPKGIVFGHLDFFNPDEEQYAETTSPINHQSKKVAMPCFAEF